jgi:hypothetical protein
VKPSSQQGTNRAKFAQLIVKLIAHFEIDFARLVEMSASKRRAIIEQKMAVGDTQAALT